MQSRQRHRDTHPRPCGFYVLWFLLLMVFAACANPVPPQKTASVLYRDLQRLVSLESSKGWKIDRTEIEDLLPDALLSVCAVPKGIQQSLGLWLLEREKELGGPLDQAYRKQKSFEGLAALTEVSRVRMLYDRVLQSSESDCPFWVEPNPEFSGHQILDDRWLLSAAGGGKLIGVHQAGEIDVIVGGAGRLLLGRGVTEHWTYLTGVELGGGARFPKEDGGRSKLSLVVDAVLPAIVRYRMVNTYIEVELGYLVHVSEEDLMTFNHGARAGIALGLQYSKQLYVLPSASFGISYDRVFNRITGEAPVDYLKLGFRGVVDLPF